MEDGLGGRRDYTKRENILLGQIRRLTAEYQRLANQGLRQEAGEVVQQLEAAIDKYAKERVRNTSARGRGKYE